MVKTIQKPSPDFPLTAHSQGYFVKRILGKTHYFGKRWGCPYDALRDYEFKRPYLEVGIEPPQQGGTCLREALDRFLVAKSARVKSGELSARCFDDYKTQCKRILKVINGGRQVDSLLPPDFGRLRESFKGSPISIGNYVVRSKVAFNWIEKNLGFKASFGDQFEKPSRTTVRNHRNEQPKRMFEPGQILKLTVAASPQLKAMILLGINCGFGNTDCGTLPIEKLDLENGWHNFARPKTGIERRAKLWPETVDAISAALDGRTLGNAFVTKYGNSWATGSKSSPISAEFRKVADKLEIERSFYDLRRTFQTIADDSLDTVAVKYVMGHTDASMSGVYRQLVPDFRLQKVADVVHDWLFTGT